MADVPARMTHWRDVPLGATVLYGIPREVLVNDPWGAQRTVMLDGIPAIYPRANDTVQVINKAERSVIVNPDDALLADLRRVATTADPAPTVAVHESHHPERPGTGLLEGCTVCFVCCLIVAGTRGVLPAGIRPCTGPGRVELRDVR